MPQSTKVILPAQSAVAPGTVAIIGGKQFSEEIITRTLKPAQSAVAPGLLTQAMALAQNERITDPKKRIYKIREVGAEEGYVKSNITVPDCGHTMNPTEHPRHTNCNSCWGVFFRLHPAIVAATKSALETLGEDGIKRAYGKKFLRSYKRFAEGQQ